MAEWRENDAEWYEERMVHCVTCGRMIAKRYLAETSAGTKIYCSEECLASTTTTCSSSAP